MLVLLLALALSQQPAAVGSVQPTERPQRFTVSFEVAPGASRWEFHRCPRLGQCMLLARGNGSQLGATLDEANAKLGDSYVVSVWRKDRIEKVELGHIDSLRYWAALPVVSKE